MEAAIIIRTGAVTTHRRRGITSQLHGITNRLHGITNRLRAWSTGLIKTGIGIRILVRVTSVVAMIAVRVTSVVEMIAIRVTSVVAMITVRMPTVRAMIAVGMPPSTIDDAKMTTETGVETAVKAPPLSSGASSAAFFTPGIQ
jgi:hypothetical protein